VEKSIRAVPGIAAVAVNLATERASVLAEPGWAVDPEAVEAAVKAAGYSATPVISPADSANAGSPATKGDSAEGRRDAAAHRERLRVLIAVALSVPLALPMMLGLFGIEVALPGWLQLALATPIQFWLGARFYRAGWAAARARSGNMDLLVAIGMAPRPH